MDILTSLQGIGFDIQLALAHLVNFLIVVALLHYFVFDPLRERLYDRKVTIEKGVADARAAEKERFRAKEEAEEIVTAAKREKREILTRAQEEAQAVKDRAEDEAESKADAIINQAHKEIAADRESMKAELQGQIGDLAVLAAEKIIEREVTNDDHQQLVADVINTASNG